MTTATTAPVGQAAPSATAVIEASGLTKRYTGSSRNPVTALDGLTLAVPPGVIGLVGANGAGKSTLIKILLGLLAPTFGTAAVLGYDVVDQAEKIRTLVGYMPEHDCLPPDVTATEFVTHMGRMSGLPPTAAKERAAESLRHVGLYEERYRQIGTYSTGMKQRVKLAQALVGDPRLLLLDEPTIGLDPAGRASMLDLVSRIGAEFGISILVSSHLLGEIEQICDHLLMIQQGRLAFQGPVDDLFATQVAELLARPEHPEQAGALIALAEQAGHRARLAVEEPPGTVAVDAGASWAGDLNRLAAAAGITLVHLSERPRRLEEAFFALTGAADGDVGSGAPGGGR